MVTTAASDLSRPTSGTPGAPRRIDRRRRLPGTRAAVGGFLVAVAAVGSFAAYTGAHRAPHQLYAVAVRSLAPGSRIGPSDVALVALNLPDPAVRRNVFGSTTALVGASVIEPINAGSLIESEAVVGRGGAVGTREISMTLDKSRAVGGTLKAGEYVDVLATFGNGADSYTAVVAPHVRVLTLSSSGGPLGDNRTEVIVFSAADATVAEALADASVAAQVTLVRAAEQADGAPATTVAPYHAPAASGNMTSTSATR